jgi:hypothetical protein
MLTGMHLFFRDLSYNNLSGHVPKILAIDYRHNTGIIMYGYIRHLVMILVSLFLFFLFLGPFIVFAMSLVRGTKLCSPM